MPATTPRSPQRGLPRKKVTVSAIAARAGVSPATVSLVLNRRGKELRINKATQQRVRDAARQLNYVPNYLARGLTGASTKSIGMVWPLGGAPANAFMGYQLIQRIAQRGYVCHMTDHLSMIDVTRRALIDQLQRRVDGLILHAGGVILDDPGVRDALEEFDTAVVISPREADLHSDLRHDVIHHDRAAAMAQAVDHLVSIGRKRIGLHALGKSNAIKIRAVTQRMEALGIDPPRAVVPLFEASEDAYIAEGRRLLDVHYADADFDFDAVICTNDSMAVAVMDFLRTKGLRVPEDVAVVGFDDSAIAPMLNPPLASVTRYDGEAAAAAEEALFDRMHHPQREPLRQTVAMTFTWRASAGAPRSD